MRKAYPQYMAYIMNTANGPKKKNFRAGKYSVQKTQLKIKVEKESFCDELKKCGSLTHYGILNDNPTPSLKKQASISHVKNMNKSASIDSIVT